MYKIVDYLTKKEVQPTNMVFTGANNPWEILMDMESIKNKINIDYFKTIPPRLSKYLQFFPIKQAASFVSLNEAATPLVKSKFISNLIDANLFFKIEGKNPTGSFKDRGSAVDISVAKEMGAKGIILASTGNMAASCACYASLAKIPCFIIVPEGVPLAKLSQVIAFGANIVQVKGSYNDAAKIAEEVAKEQNFYLAGDYAFRVEGQKAAAFELVDQMFFQVPDAVVIPIGCGTNMAGYKKGFEEYKYLGITNSIPKLIGVQSSGACPVVNSYNSKARTITGLASIDTLAGAIAVNNPIDGLKALDAIYETNGMAIDVSDNEILQAQYLLSKNEGIFAETASSATVAAIIKNKEHFKGKTIVCILTGDGLKDSQNVLKSATKSPTIAATTSDFLKLYNKNYFKSNTMIFMDKNTEIFKEEPTETSLQDRIEEIFGVKYDIEYIRNVKAIISKILQKGKSIMLSDLQDSIQDAFEFTMIGGTKKHLSVEDFSVQTSKDKRASASVTVKLDGKLYSASSDGVGPVDAALNALSKACAEKVSFKLLDYKVEIRNSGIDAVVCVDIKLSQGNNVSMGQGISPDIIQASVEAFESAYHGFH